MPDSEQGGDEHRLGRQAPGGHRQGQHADRRPRAEPGHEQAEAGRPGLEHLLDVDRPEGDDRAAADEAHADPQHDRAHRLVAADEPEALDQLPPGLAPVDPLPVRPGPARQRAGS